MFRRARTSVLYHGTSYAALCKHIRHSRRLRGTPLAPGRSLRAWLSVWERQQRKRIPLFKLRNPNSRRDPFNPNNIIAPDFVELAAEIERTRQLLDSLASG